MIYLRKVVDFALFSNFKVSFSIVQTNHDRERNLKLRILGLYMVVEWEPCLIGR